MLLPSNCLTPCVQETYAHTYMLVWRLHFQHLVMVGSLFSPGLRSFLVAAWSRIALLCTAAPLWPPLSNVAGHIEGDCVIYSECLEATRQVFRQ